MAVYSVHLPPDAEDAREAVAERLLFVPERFSFPAFLFAPFWILWHGLWRTLLIWIVLALAVSALIWPMGESWGATAIGLLFAFAFASEAQELRRWELGRRGWREIGIAVGRDRLEAEARFITAFLEGRVATGVQRRAPPSAGFWPQGEEVIGVMPMPEGRR